MCNASWLSVHCCACSVITFAFPAEVTQFSCRFKWIWMHPNSRLMLWWCDEISWASMDLLMSLSMESSLKIQSSFHMRYYNNKKAGNDFQPFKPITKICLYFSTQRLNLLSFPSPFNIYAINLLIFSTLFFVLLYYSHFSPITLFCITSFFDSTFCSKHDAPLLSNTNTSSHFHKVVLAYFPAPPMTEKNSITSSPGLEKKEKEIDWILLLGFLKVEHFATCFKAVNR